MNRKKRRCPYCGRRMSYFAAYASRRKAEYVCSRCGKESRVVISKLIIPLFIIVAVISLAIMGVWFFFKLLSNPLGIVLVAAPLVIFLLFTPKFVHLEPLKKYQKSMEAKKAGIEYSDNLTALDCDDEVSSMENSLQFKINSDLFNQIKSSRSSPREQRESKDIVSDSRSIEEEKLVPVIKDVSEDHAGSSDTPLRKIRHESRAASRSLYLDDGDEEAFVPDKSAQERASKSKAAREKTRRSNYSANRRF